MSGQMIWGTVILATCVLLHVLFLIADIRLLKWLSSKLWASGAVFSTVVLLGAAVTVVVLSHSVQV